MNEYIVEIFYRETDSAETDPSILKIVTAKSEAEAISKAIAIEEHENPDRPKRKAWATNVEKRPSM